MQIHIIKLLHRIHNSLMTISNIKYQNEVSQILTMILNILTMILNILNRSNATRIYHLSDFVDNKFIKNTQMLNIFS